MLTRRSFIGSLAAAPFAASPAFAAGAAFFAPEGYAIGGFDPVAYFKQGAPVAGQARYSLVWRNAVWQFATSANMDVFERNPYGFAPRYGGYCAMSLTQGVLSRTRPQAWAIHDGHLYLTHSEDARDRWQQNPDAFIQQANAQWPTALCPEAD